MLVKEAPNSNGSPTFPEQTETSCKPCSGLNSTSCKMVVNSFMRQYKFKCVVCIVFCLFVSFFFNSAYKITFIQCNDLPNLILHGENNNLHSSGISSYVIVLGSPVGPLMRILTHWPLGIWLQSTTSKFQTHFNDKYLKYFLWNCHQVNAKTSHWSSVNIGSGNRLVLSGNKPLPKPMLT